MIYRKKAIIILGYLPLLLSFIQCRQNLLLTKSNINSFSKVNLETSKVIINGSYKIITDDSDIWMSYSQNDSIKYDFKIGGAGAMAQLRWRYNNSSQSLLSPSYASEHTDRVIQSTWWSDNILCNINSDPEKRWNVTQAGDGQGTFSPTFKVNINNDSNWVDVYSFALDQFNHNYDTVLHGGFKILTRYHGLPGGVIEVRRIMIATQPDSSGYLKNYEDLYAESWTPFLSDPDVFNALAFSLDSTGAPNWWYLANYNIPTYPNFSVTQTKGYGIVYNTSAETSNIYAAWVFGKNLVNQDFNGYSVLNTMNWNNGIGILPGLTFNNFPVGGVIDQEFYIYIDNKRNANTGTFLDSLVNDLPVTHTYSSTSTMPAELSTMVNKINNFVIGSGNRTEHLASLVNN